MFCHFAIKVGALRNYPKKRQLQIQRRGWLIFFFKALKMAVLVLRSNVMIWIKIRKHFDKSYFLTLSSKWGRTNMASVPKTMSGYVLAFYIFQFGWSQSGVMMVLWRVYSRTISFSIYHYKLNKLQILGTLYFLLILWLSFSCVVNVLILMWLM